MVTAIFDIVPNQTPAAEVLLVEVENGPRLSRRCMYWHQQHEVLTLSEHREELTLASVWQSLAGIGISDEFLDWPADVFTYGSDP
jgi:hypothetical protein